MTKPGFIVEGHMEKDIIQRICDGRPVRMFHNGRSVAPSALAKQAATLIKLMKYTRPIIILFDREMRHESCTELSSAFLKALSGYGVSENDVIVGVADRMIENWILACASVRQKYQVGFVTEGYHGKGKLSEVMDLAGEHYHERIEGVEMFIGIDKVSAMANSESFKLFAKSISPYCEWMRRKKAKRSR